MNAFGGYAQTGGEETDPRTGTVMESLNVICCSDILLSDFLYFT